MDFNPVCRAFIIVSEKYLTKKSFSKIENNITFDNANLKKPITDSNQSNSEKN